MTRSRRHDRRKRYRTTCTGASREACDHLAASDRYAITATAEGGEWGETVDNLVAALVKTNQTVSTQERDELTSLVEAMDLETTEPLDRLIVKP